MDRTAELRRAGAPLRVGMTAGEARDLVRSSLGADPWSDVEHLRLIGDELAEAEGIVTRLEGETKSVKARIQNELAVIHAKESLSEAKLERMALGDDRYSTHVKGLAAAVELREKLKNAYWTAKAKLDWDDRAIGHYNHLTRMDGGR